MTKEKTEKGIRSKKVDRGISPSKVAYAYGISLETFNKWIENSENLSDLIYEGNLKFIETRKWTPNQLQMIFDEFGDPREYKEIIDSYGM